MPMWSQHLPEEWMALLLFCMTDMRAPTMPWAGSAAAGEAGSEFSTWNTVGGLNSLFVFLLEMNK